MVENPIDFWWSQTACKRTFLGRKNDPKFFFVPTPNFLGFEDDFIADGSFIDPISNSWEVGKIINIAYKPHNRTLLRSNIKMDHLYRSMKDRASGRDYEAQMNLRDYEAQMNLREAIRPKLNRVAPGRRPELITSSWYNKWIPAMPAGYITYLSHLCDEYGISTPFSYLQIGPKNRLKICYPKSAFVSGWPRRPKSAFARGLDGSKFGSQNRVIFGVQN